MKRFSRALEAFRTICYLIIITLLLCRAAAAQQPAVTDSGAAATVKITVYANPYQGSVLFYNEKGQLVQSGITGKEYSLRKEKYSVLVVARDGLFSVWKAEMPECNLATSWSRTFEYHPPQKKTIKWARIFWLFLFLSLIGGGSAAYMVRRRMNLLRHKITETIAEGVASRDTKSARIPERIDRFKVVEKIGQGGMAVVYKAQDKHGDIFALKVPHSHIFDVPEFRARFIREAEIIKTLSHPNIVRMYDYDLKEEAPVPYICLEFVEGKAFDVFLVENPIIPTKKAVKIAIDIASALGYAHSKSIIHRDIKPENIMLTPKHQIKVMDLGIARASLLKSLTATGTTLGTPHYMAPEQVGGKNVDGRADLYSLGVILYEMLTAHLPFESDEPMTVMMMHMTEDPPPPSTHNKLINRDLERIIMKLLEKNPQDRFKNAGELISALNSHL